MELPDIVEFARKFSVMVRINGPDPKGLKMRNHAFHQYHSGKTTLSASGLLLPHSLVGSEIHDKGAVIVTVASIVEPFLSQKSKLINAQGTPELIPGAQIDVMVEVNVGVENKDENPKWFGAKVLKLVDVPAASSAIKSLIEASSGSLEHGWEIGWSLAAHKDSSQKFKGSMQTQEITSSTERPRDVNMMAQFASRIAFLQVPSLLHKVKSQSPTIPSVLLCMEGGPVFGQNGCLVGILNRPLRQAGGAEIQVVVPWKAIESACNGQFQLVPEKSERIQFVGDFCGVRTATMNCLNCRASPNVIEKQPVGYCSVPLTVEHAMSSVCLITLNNGVWASGILLNEQGLILTNAHLLEPWRFGRTPIQSGLGDTRIKNNFYMLDDSMPLRQAVEQTSAVVQSSSVQSLNYLRNSHGINPNHQVHSEISVRVDLMESWLWCKAKVVYISKGPLDISLLQLESVPKQLSPIRADLTFPSPGSKAFVIGHGLLGPRCDLLPTISSGVVAKVVKAKKHVPDQSTLLKSPAGEIPVMLETTAAVHPGGSGGAVINSSGHLIALVTSNAKHGGGTVIPHMNFSIPSAALEPVFKIAKDMQNLSVLQQLDRPNKDLTSVWAMMPSISPDPDPSLHSADDLLRKDEGKQSKGSQFAKFINEKKKLLGNSRHLNTMQNLSRDTISSKL
uniref:Glyoxysomal processing protease, glyoxysomal n=1 Tax=Chenopodium quinoa TaxID=63459 RepID=A0A803LQ16_CHEQI